MNSVVNHLELQAAYDLHMRRESWIPGFERFRTADTSRYVSHDGEQAMLMWHRFGADVGSAKLGERVRAELQWFRKRSKMVFWKLYAHDQPPGLADVLLAEGAEMEDVSVLHMVPTSHVLAHTRMPVALAVHSSIRSADLARTNAVWNEVWPEHPEENEKWTGIYAQALNQFEAAGQTPAVCFFSATYADALPAPANAIAAGYIIHPPGTPLALLCGGAVRKAHRGKGAYTALLHSRAQWAATRGASQLAIEASPMSQPIVQRLGFTPLVGMAFYKFRF